MVNYVALQDAVMSELKNRSCNIKDKKIIAQEEVYHGALEDILLGMFAS